MSSYLTRGLLVLVTAAAWLLASMAATASAQLEIFSEEANEPCPEVTIEVHHVEGGCLVEYRSTEHFQRLFYVASVGVVLVSECTLHLTAQIGPDGSGYVSEARFEEEPPPHARTCADEACDEATHEMIPWPLQITEVGPGDEWISLDVCRRPGPNLEEGYPGTECELDMPFTHTGQHTQEIGDHSEYLCDSPVPPISMTLKNIHLVNEEAESPFGIEPIH